MRRIALGSMLVALGIAAPVLAQQKIGDVVEGFVLDAHLHDEATRTADGRLVKRYVVTEPGAGFLKLHFGQMRLAVGEKLDLLDGDLRLVESYTGKGPSGSGQFWAMSVRGDTAILRYETTGRGFFEVDRYARSTLQPQPESVCPGTGNDFTSVACAGNLTGPAATLTEETRPAVAHIRFVDSGGVYMCTGSAVSGNKHFLTNEHCFPAHSQAQCDSYELYFDYENPTCSATTGVRGSALRCSKLLKYNATLDYALLEMNAYPGSHLTLNGRNLTKGEYLYIVQHPSGYPKKVAEDEVLLPVVDGRGQDTDFSYQAETLGGSSGSPVLDASGEVIGLHHFGGCSASAGNQGVRMARILPEIEDLLGPPSTDSVAVR